VLTRAVRDHAGHIDAEAINLAADAIARQAQAVQQAIDLDSLRGMEGDASRAYFSAFDHMILECKDVFFFRERSRRPPLDPMNCLLSFLYTLLMHDVQAALEAVGLDPAVGFLHRDRPGRPSLALDLMEELRPCLADRVALTLINRKQVDPAGFLTKESGGIIMHDDTRKAVITAWQKRKQEEIRHPFLDEAIPIGLIPYAQAMILARHVRGDLADYPPYFWR
jgi:CRISPR-associated protein Cas1